MGKTNKRKYIDMHSHDFPVSLLAPPGFVNIKTSDTSCDFILALDLAV